MHATGNMFFGLALSQQFKKAKFVFSFYLTVELTWHWYCMMALVLHYDLNVLCSFVSDISYENISLWGLTNCCCNVRRGPNPRLQRLSTEG